MRSAERLEESRNFWEQSVEHDKSQLRMSVAIGSSGLFLAGVGIGFAIAGHPEGILAIGTGSVITYVGAKETISDFQDYTQSNERVATRQGMAKGMDMASSRES